MTITATELKSNLSKYLLMAETEDIYITRNEQDYRRSPMPVCAPAVLLERLKVCE